MFRARVLPRRSYTSCRLAGIIRSTTRSCDSSMITISTRATTTTESSTSGGGGIARRTTTTSQRARPLPLPLHSCSTGSSLSRSRPMSTSPSASPSTATPRFAEGENAQALIPEVKMLLNDAGWALDDERMGLKKTFYFKSYFKAVSYVNLVAAESASKKHHPTLTVRIGSVDVHWTTHKPRGLSEKDISLARFCDEGARLVGVVEEGQGKKCVP